MPCNYMLGLWGSAGTAAECPACLQTNTGSGMQEDMILAAGEYLVSTLKVAQLKRQLMVTRTIYVGAAAVSVILVLRWLRQRR